MKTSCIFFDNFEINLLYGPLSAQNLGHQFLLLVMPWRLMI
jgi:hypothetical protein